MMPQWINNGRVEPGTDTHGLFLLIQSVLKEPGGQKRSLVLGIEDDRQG
jgi:hypothetical protein